MIKEACQVHEDQARYSPLIGYTEKAGREEGNQIVGLQPAISKSSILTDWIIKAILGNPEDTEALAGFLTEWKYCPIRSITVEAQEARVDHADQKAIRFDIHGTINNEIFFVIESQRHGDFKTIMKRMQYYLARLLAGQKLRGKEYGQMKAAWLILIADYPFFPRSGLIADETEMSLKTMQMPLTQMTHLSIMETGRTEYLREKAIQKLSGLERWAILYGNLGDPEKREWIRQICEQDENLRKVVRKMSEMTMDFEAYFRETKAIMAELERADRQREWLEQGKRMGKQEGLEQGLQRGMEQGIEQGMERGELCKVIKLVLKNMKKGKPISEIAEILDEDETLIRQIFICHEEHPDWTADQIATRIRN